MKTDGITRKSLHQIAQIAVNSPTDLPTAIRKLARQARRRNRPSWQQETERFLSFLKTGDVYWSIFVLGNSKLPFYSFSGLPIHACPGAGECASWCYSVKSWRNPAPFFRQLGNYLLLQSVDGRRRIKNAWEAIPDGSPIRLYVDGDFDSDRTARFWRARLIDRPELHAYGYSKSLTILAKVPMPSNYRLNLSNGGKHDAMIPTAERWPMTRGRFLAVPITSTDAAHNITRGKITRAQHTAAVRSSAVAAGIPSPIVCPGKCGACGGASGHLCGSDIGRTIVIGIH